MIRNQTRILGGACLPALITLLLCLPSTGFALCGDVTGDGFVFASDALAALKKAVAGQYDDRGDNSAQHEPDGRLSASDALGILLAAVTDTIPRCAAFKDRFVAVATASSRFDAAGVAVVDLATRAVQFRPGVLHRDSVVRKLGTEPVFLNRFGANSVQRLDLDDPALPTVKQCSLSDGFNSNPHDIARVGNKAYATLYDGAELLVLDVAVLQSGLSVSCDGLILERIDLSSLADEDGLPEMDQMAVVGNRLYVSLQMLDHTGFFLPAAPGRLAVIDVETDKIVGSIDLELENPFLETKGLIVEPRSGLLYIGGPGKVFVDQSDGGVELVDLQAGASLGVLIDGSALGGDLFDLAVVGSSRAYGIVAGADSRSRVVEIDLKQGRVSAELLSSAEAITDIELTEAGELWVSFRENSKPVTAGLRVFNIANNVELTKDPIFPGALPFTLSFGR
ncbi:MAG: hypothetical protein ACI8TX_002563 [Hyphomicrobiaceae bacterium]|jgi:hypothetical protein